MKTNIEILELIFNDVHNLITQKEVVFSIDSVLNSLVITVCHIEGKDEYDFFIEHFEKEKKYISECSNSPVSFLENPVFKNFNFIYIKLEQLKIMKYRKIFNFSGVFNEFMFTKVTNLNDFYNTEFNSLLKAPEQLNLPPIELIKSSKVPIVVNTDKDLSSESTNLKTRNNDREVPDYRWSPSDLKSPWLFIE